MAVASPRVVFVALGSRGDVQPLALLASALVGGGSDLRVSLATHAELEAVLRSGGEAALLAPEVELRPLSLPCFLKAARKEAAERPSVPDVIDVGGQRRSEWIEACLSARDADVLVCNLFALPPVYHLSERLGVPWLCCSPSLVPYAAPADFARGFRESFPELHRALRARDQAEPPSPGAPGFSWADVESWLWPLFTENHAALREELLGLPPVPGYRDRDAARSDGGGADELAAESLSPGRLLFGLPPALLAGAGASLPRRALVCGAWAPRAVTEGSQQASLAAGGTRLPEDLEAFLAAAGESAPIYVGFGSMGAEGLVPAGPRLLRTALDACRWMRRRAVVMAHTLRGGDAEWAGVDGGAGTGPDAFLCDADVPHELLLPRCAAAVHHGGVGTVVAALRARIPQLVMPLAFDQPFWARRLKELCVGDELLPEEASVPTLAQRLRRLLDSQETLGAVRELGDRLAAESGTETAVSAILAAAAEARQRPRPRAAVAGGPLLRPVRRTAIQEGLEVWARCAGEARYVHQEIAVERCYGELERLQPGSIVVDAGMNLGLFSLHLSRCWAGRGELTVLAFEPSAEVYDLAVRNLRENGVQVVEHLEPPPQLPPPRPSAGGALGGRPGSLVVHCFRAALAEHEGEEDFCYFPHLSTGSTLARHRAQKEEQRRGRIYNGRLVEFFFAEERRERVPCLRLSTALARLGPEFGTEGPEPPPPVELLKCDVEGAEASVLRGLDPADWQRVRHLAVEVHTPAALEELQALLARDFRGEVWSVAQPELPGHSMLYGAPGPPQLPPAAAATVAGEPPAAKRARAAAGVLGALRPFSP